MLSQAGKERARHGKVVLQNRVASPKIIFDKARGLLESAKLRDAEGHSHTPSLPTGKSQQESQAFIIFR